MSEMEPHEAEMDSLLRRCMAAPIPNLSPDFNQRLLREARRSSHPLSRYGQILLTGYGLLSVVASAVVMRVQGLGWPAIAMTMLGSLKRSSPMCKLKPTRMSRAE